MSPEMRVHQAALHMSLNAGGVHQELPNSFVNSSPSPVDSKEKAFGVPRFNFFKKMGS